MKDYRVAISITIFVLAVAFLLAISGCTSGTKPVQEGSALQIYYNSEEQPSEKNAIAQVLQSQLSQKGIPVTLDPVSSTVFNDRLTKGEFGSTLALWYLDYDDPEGFLTDFYSKSGFRMSKYDNPEYDRVYLEGLFAPQEQLKIQKFREAATILANDLPWIPLYSNNEIFLMKPEAKGFRSNAYQYYDYRAVPVNDLRVSSDVEVQTLDPALAYDLASKHLVTQSYEGLVAMDEQSRLVPSLAETWTVSPNSDQLSFQLRKGVRFHGSDNREMTSADVKASLERMVKANSPYSYILDYVEGVEDFKSNKSSDIKGLQTPDKYSFTIKLTRPCPAMLHWLLAPAAYVLPKGLPTDYDFSKGSVGTGPFVLQSWDGAIASFKANPAYWMNGQDGKKLPLPSTLSIRVIKDVTAALTAFKQGDLDILNVPLALFSQVFDNNGNLKDEWKSYEYREVKLNNLKMLVFNMQKDGQGLDLQRRKAIAAAIDRQAIVQQLFRGKARPATSIIPSGMPGFE